MAKKPDAEEKIPLSKEEILSMVEKGEIPIQYIKNETIADTFTLENVEKFLAHEMTWAQLQGMTKEEAYALAQKAYEFFEEGKGPDARTIMEGLVLSNPHDAYFHGLLGSFYQRSSMPDEAIEEYSIAVQLNPKDIQSHVNLSELLIQKGDFDQSMTHLKQAVELDPQGENPASLRARIIAKATATIMENVLEAQKKG